jgi:hypothetical protein
MACARAALLIAAGSTGGLLADAVGFQLALWIPFGSFVVTSLILLAAPIRGGRDLPTRRTEASELAGTIGA